MQCSEVGFEIWLIFAFSSALLVAFVLSPRRFQAWLRTHRTKSWLARAAPDSFFGASGVWAMRALGFIPALMWIAAATGVYCFFHGPG